MNLENQIEWSDFEKIDLRVGRIHSARLNPKARKPSYILEIDLGELGVKTSSSQITDKYKENDLIGMQVLCVCNFPVKIIAGCRSEVLVTGVYDDLGEVVLATFNFPLKPGGRLL